MHERNSVEKFSEMRLTTHENNLSQSPTQVSTILTREQSNENLILNHQQEINLLQKVPTSTLIINQKNNINNQNSSKTTFSSHQSIKQEFLLHPQQQKYKPQFFSTQMIPEKQLNCNLYDLNKQQDRFSRSHLSTDYNPSMIDYKSSSAQLKQSNRTLNLQPNFQQSQNFLHSNYNQYLQETTIPIMTETNNYQPNHAQQQRMLSQFDNDNSFHNKNQNKFADVCLNSDDTFQFAQNLDAFFNNNIPGFILMTFAILQVFFGIVSIFIGTFKFSLCYVEQKIPVYLILSGIILIVNGSFHMCLRIPLSKTKTIVCNGQLYRQSQQKTFATGSMCRFALENTIYFLIIIIVIFGCVWVYSAKYVQFEPYRFERNYCNYTLYLFAWWSITIHLIFISMIIITLITILIYGAMKSK